MWFLGLWIPFNLLCLLESTVEKVLLMLLDGVFRVNATDDILRSWSFMVFVRETVAELSGLWTVAGVSGQLVLHKCLQIFWD